MSMSYIEIYRQSFGESVRLRFGQTRSCEPDGDYLLGSRIARNLKGQQSFSSIEAIQK